MQSERRSENRSLAMFKAAYIEHRGRLSLVHLRDISSSGVCFSGDVDVTIGDPITYCIDDATLCRGHVIWVQGGKFGVKAAEDAAIEPRRPAYRRPRSVRLPIDAQAWLFMGQGRVATNLHNLSLRGTCICDPGGIQPGQLLSLEIAGEIFELATVKWTRDGRAGIHFAQPLRAPAFNAILDRLQGIAREDGVEPDRFPLVVRG
jgi:hypothetical protein